MKDTDGRWGIFNPRINYLVGEADLKPWKQFAPDLEDLTWPFEGALGMADALNAVCEQDHPGLAQDCGGCWQLVLLDDAMLAAQAQEQSTLSITDRAA